MKRHVRLSDLGHLADPVWDFSRVCFSADQVSLARAALVAKALRFDNVTGVARDNNMGERTAPGRGVEFAPYKSVESIMASEFRPLIGNSASRLARGFPA